MSIGRLFGHLTILGTIAAALLTALLVPTDCRCGAEIPHPHVLVGLAGHDHRSHNHVHASSDAMIDDHSSPTVVSWSMPLPFSNQLPIAWMGGFFLFLSIALIGTLWLSLHSPTGYISVPPAPPPRTH